MLSRIFLSEAGGFFISTENSISEEAYSKWINNLDKPTLNQIRLISEKTKRPIAIFFLEKIPEEKPLPKDFRLNPKKEGKFEKNTTNHLNPFSCSNSCWVCWRVRSLS